MSSQLSNTAASQLRLRSKLFSGRASRINMLRSIVDIILFCGGVFLLYKTTIELHNKIQGYDDEAINSNKSTFKGIVFQIVLIDIVFSFDSILTAVGLVNNLIVMILAVFN